MGRADARARSRPPAAYSSTAPRAALVTISATTENMPIGVDELIARVRGLDGVIRFDALAG